MASWVNLPNLLTLIRLLMVPFIVEAILGGRHWLALALFLTAGFTDFLDGAVARRLGRVTRAGAYLDPIADKCLLSGVFLALAWAGLAPLWVVGLVIGRDIFILLGVLAVMWMTPQRKFPPSRWGKLSTLIQIATVICWMASNVLEPAWVQWLASAAAWPCALITVISGAHYLWRARQAFGRIDAVSAGE